MYAKRFVYDHRGPRGGALMEYMIGTYKFECDNDDDALKIAKRVMLEKGWRNLRLMRKEKDGWGVRRIIPSFENGK